MQNQQDQRLYKFQLVDDCKYGGIFTPEQVHQLSQKVMKYYDGNGDGVIENMEVRNMMSDAYRAINKEFKPTATDLVQYTRVITRRTDAYKIQQSDIHNVCAKFFLAKEFSQKQPSLQEHAKHAHVVRKAPQYSKSVQERLEVARRLFRRIDADQSGYITEEEVPKLLQDTYAQMGMNDYQVSKDDVKSWMQMTDTDGDGKVTIEEYEALVIRSLERAGIKLY